MGGGFGATFSVNCRRYDSAGVTGAFAAGEEAFKADVLEGLVIADYAYGR